MPTPIGMHRVSCSAHPGQNGRQCLASKNLTAVLTRPIPQGMLALPSHVVILLCPKHLKFKATEAKEK